MIRLLILLLYFPITAYCQVEYFEYTNHNTIELTSERIRLLTSKTWYFYKAIDILRGDTTITYLSGEIKYDASGEYEFHFMKGNWDIVKKQYLSHESDDADQAKRKNFGGIYAVVKLNNEELVLNKLQTSSHDMSKTYYLTSKPKSAPMSYYQNRSNLKKLDPASIQKYSEMSIEQAFFSGMFLEGDTLLVPTQDSVYRIKLRKGFNKSHD